MKLQKPVIIRTKAGRVLLTITSLEDFYDWLTNIILPYHESTDHGYEPSTDWSTTCEYCGWIHPEAPLPKGFSCSCQLLIEHAERIDIGRRMGVISEEFSDDELIFRFAFYLGLDTDQPEDFKKMQRQDIHITIRIGKEERQGGIDPRKN